MFKKTLASIVVVAALAAGLGAAVVWTQDAAEQHQPALAYSWKPHHTYSYRWRQQERTTGSVPGELVLDGTVLVAVDDVSGGVTTFRLSFEPTSGTRLTMGGQEAWTSEAHLRRAFAGHSVRVQVTDSGEVQSVGSTGDTPAEVVLLLCRLVRELSVPLAPTGESWDRSEDEPHGLHSRRYTIVERSEIGTTVDRTELEPPRLHSGQAVRSLEAQGRAVIHADGHLASLSSRAVLVMQDSTRLTGDLSASLIGVRPSAASTDSGWSPVAWGYQARMERSRERALLARVGDMSEEELSAEIARFGSRGAGPNHERFVWQASGWLKKNPEGCASLGAMFTSGTSGQRALALDLLVAAGHPTAQRELLRLIESPEAVQDGSYTLLRQRLGFVQSPTPELVDAVHRTFLTTRDVGGVDGEAAGYTLGSMARNLALSGHPEEAARATEMLTEALAQSRSTSEQADLLLAVGNAASDETMGMVSAFAMSDSPTVRAAAVTAMRRNQRPETEEAARRLLRDPDPTVQRATLRTMEQWRLDDGQLDQLARLADAGDVHSSAVPDVVRLSSRYATSNPDQVERTLASLLDYGVDDDHARGNAQFLLAKLERR